MHTTIAMTFIEEVAIRLQLNKELTYMLIRHHKCSSSATF